MLRIRLRRMGKRNRPFYRIVVTDARAPQGGAFADKVGSYDPLPDPPRVSLDMERIQHWIKQGAQPSAAVARLLKQQSAVQEPGER